MPCHRSLPSLRHYLLLSQSEPLIEHFVRSPPPGVTADPANQAQVWTFGSYGPGTTVRLTALGIDLPVDEVYARLEEVPAADETDSR